MEWIDIKDGLPDNRYICQIEHTKNGAVTRVLRYHAGIWYYEDSDTPLGKGYFVTKWMPFPRPTVLD